MATANFWTMQNFPLYARDFTDENGDFDDWECDVICDDIETELFMLNNDFLFHRIELKSGYYCGVQFYVQTKHDPDGDAYDNEDCHYYFDMCRSVTMRKYHAEQNKINKILAKIAQKYAFDKLAVCACFSNGETWYSKTA